MEVPTAQELLTKNDLSQKELSSGVTRELLVAITMEMNKWREIAPHFFLEATEIEDIAEKGQSPQERRLLMLEKWKEKYGSDASFFKLVEVFLQAGRRDLADKVCDFFKKKVLPKQAEAYYTPTVGSLTNLDHPQDEPQRMTQDTSNTATTDIHETADQGIELQQMTGSAEMQNSETTQNEESFVYYNRRQAKVKNYLGNGCCIVSIVVCIILAIGIPIIFITVGATVYKVYAQTTVLAYIPNGRTLLLGEFDPFYFRSLTLSSATDTHFYKTPCKQLYSSNWVSKRTIQRSTSINITQQNTYQVYGNYLVRGSRLNFTFEFQNVTVTPECQMYVYVFNDRTAYTSFLKHGTRSQYITRKCIQSDSYTFIAEHTQYYDFGFYVADTSLADSLVAGINGSELYFTDDQHEPDCVTVANLRRSCTFHFKKEHVRISNNICILGSTPQHDTTVTYSAYPNYENTKVRAGLLGFGIPVFGIILFCFCGIVGIIIDIALKRT